MISLGSTEGGTQLKDLFQKGKDALTKGKDALTKGKGTLAAEEFNKAKSLYERVTREDPNCIEAWNNLGVASCELDLHREALDAYGRIGEDRRTETTWYNISLVYYYSRDFAQALDCIQKAIDMD